MRRKIVSLSLIVLLALSTVTLLEFSLTEANPYIKSLPETLATEHGYIRANGTVDPPTLPILREDNFYRLTDNILNCTFEIQRDNVVFDGNNFSLSVPAYGELDCNNMTKIPPALISISNRTNVMLKNVTFIKYSDGIEIQNSSNILILQNNILNGNNGIYINNSTNCSITANQITNNHLHAIFIRDSTWFNVSYNTISNSQNAGIAVDRVLQPVDSLQNSFFTRNTFSEDNFALAFRGAHTNNHIFENNFLNNQQCGIAFLGVNCTHNSIYNNYWTGNGHQIINYTNYEQDPSPLASPISTEFNYSLFTLPDFAQPHPIKHSIFDNLATIVVAASIVTVIIICIFLLVYFKKRKH